MNQRFLRVKVHPDARVDRIEAKGKDVYEAWVRAPAEEGRANASVLTLLCRRPELAGRGLRIVKGARNSSKIVAVIGSCA